MADPFGIIGVIGVAIQIIQISAQFGLDWKDAPAEAKTFKAELDVLRTVLSETKKNILDNQEFVDAFQGRNSALLSHLGDGKQETDTSLLVSACRTELESLVENLKKRCQGHRAGWDRIKGAFQARKTREAVENLHRHCQTLNNMVVIDTASLGASTYNIVDGLQKQQQKLSLAENDSALRERKSAILRKLYTSPYRDRKDRNPERVEGTCEWFTSHSLFQTWQNTDSSALLWVSADPGCGKSVLAKYLVENVLQSSTTRTTCYFFFKDDFEDQRSLEGCLCCILRQIFVQKPDLLSDKILEKFDSGGERLLGSFRDLWDALIDIAADKASDVNRTTDQHPAEVVCILDGLDECEENGQRQLIGAFRKLNWTSKSNFALKFLLTSRPHIHVQRAFSSLKNIVPTIHLSGESEDEVEKISQEINVVIDFRVRELTTRLDLLPEEQQVLEDELARVPNRTYLWVHLVFEIIQDSIDISEESLRSQIRKLPKTVEAAYEKILSRSRDPGKAKRLLHIVVAAARPLSLEEMALALAIREDHEAYSDLKLEPASRFRNTVREICGLLVVIINSEIYLLHQTAKEFLVQQEPCDLPDPLTQEIDSLQWKFSLLPKDSHRVLAEICMWQLLWTDDELHPVDWYRDIGQFLNRRTMLKYSVTNWFTHFRDAHLENDTAMVSLAYRLCFHEERALSWFRIYWKIKLFYSYIRAFNGLITASYFGLESVVRLLLQADYIDLNSKDAKYGQTALAWAAQNGHDAVVELLISTEGVDIDAKNSKGETPLSLAILRRRQAVAKMLLATGRVAIDSENNSGQTPLHFDAENGIGSILRLSHSTGQVDLDSKDYEGRTPLMYAAMRGPIDIVMFLLETGKVDADRSDISGRTPLSYAAEHGHKEVVKVLLTVGKADPQSRDRWGKTPLSHAAGNGYKEVVKVLTVGKADPKCADEQEMSPLTYAAAYGRSAFIKLLLKTGRIDTDYGDHLGRTPLSYAAENGHKDAVKVFLSVGKVDPQRADRLGKTPLTYAAARGRGAVIKLLLETGKIDADYGDHLGRTPLSYAAENGHRDAVKVLLSVGKADPRSRDREGHAPVWYATYPEYPRKECEDVAELLRLETPDEFLA